MGYVILSHKQKCFVNSFIIIALSIVLGTVGVAVVIGICLQKAKVSGFLGNRLENIAHMKDTTDPNDFTFLVVGDVRVGTATFEEMMDILKADMPAFAVILGDFISNATPNGYRLFKFEITEHAQDFPIFLVLGNHELGFADELGLEDFESMWGPSEFYFTLGTNLFVFLNNTRSHSKTPAYFDFLEQILCQHAKEVVHIFIFMHVPPFRPDDSPEFHNAFGNKEFLNLVKKYHVDYVFSGDHHGYIKTEREGTTFIITGGGGARLRGKHGGFHHLTRITVNNEKISETVVAVKKSLETFELIERNIVEYIWAPITNNTISIATTLLLYAILIWLLIISVRYRRQLCKGINGLSTN